MSVFQFVIIVYFVYFDLWILVIAHEVISFFVVVDLVSWYFWFYSVFFPNFDLVWRFIDDVGVEPSWCDAEQILEFCLSNSKINLIWVDIVQSVWLFVVMVLGEFSTDAWDISDYGELFCGNFIHD